MLKFDHKKTAFVKKGGLLLSFPITLKDFGNWGGNYPYRGL